MTEKTAHGGNSPGDGPLGEAHIIAVVKIVLELTLGYLVCLFDSASFEVDNEEEEVGLIGLDGVESQTALNGKIVKVAL